MPAQTPSQTVGPYFAYALTPEPYGYPGIASNRLVDIGTPGERILLRGRVLDGAGEPVEDALLEIWQADASGRYPTEAPGEARGFRGFGRCGTDAEGRFSFETVKPGRVPGPDGKLQAPHIAVIVTARGLLNHLVTRIYFADEVAANASDPILALVPEDRRATLIARREDHPGGPVYRFDIHLQGEQETVFFDV
ncbi:Protocatechuate 3,4-dioxygenase alpha chain [bacterium HR40]|nr:Protocatechuate 3,4-dioxygenase alpha chain [bacterium HR40]